jgi:hypothetical protein
MRQRCQESTRRRASFSERPRLLKVEIALRFFAGWLSLTESVRRNENRPEIGISGPFHWVRVGHLPAHRFASTFAASSAGIGS